MKILAVDQMNCLTQENEKTSAHVWVQGKMKPNEEVTTAVTCELDKAPGTAGMTKQGREGTERFQCHFPMTLQHVVTFNVVVSCSTVIVGLVLRLEPGDEQKPCIGPGVFGSREAAGDPGALVLIGV